MFPSGRTAASYVRGRRTRGVKLTFAKGASLKDPARLFNASLKGNTRRAIDMHEGENINEAAMKDLIRDAVALNLAGKRKPKPSA